MMDNKLISYITALVIGDLLFSIAQNVPIDKRTPELAALLYDEGIDFDFVLVLSGANRNNLREVTNLAFEEVERELTGGIEYVLSNHRIPETE